MENQRRVLYAVAAATVLATPPLFLQSASASVLRETATPVTYASSSSSTAENLTRDGTVDWAIWDSSSGTTYNGAPSNTASGLTDVFSSVSSLSGQGVRGSSKGGTLFYSYTNGTSPASNNAEIHEVLDNELQTAGSGITFTIQGNPNTPEIAEIFLTGNLTGSSFSATMDSQTVIDTTVTYTNNNPTTTALYTIEFEPNSSSDPLSITYVATGTQGSFANVGLQAIAVSVATPEPTSIGAFAVAACLALRRRR